MTVHVAGVVLLLLALLLGLRLPDPDQQVQFLVHRSILTHGYLSVTDMYLSRVIRELRPQKYPLRIQIRNDLHPLPVLIHNYAQSRTTGRPIYSRHGRQAA